MTPTERRISGARWALIGLVAASVACHDSVAPRGGPGVIVSVVRGASDPSCRTVAESPALISGLVIPRGSVECPRMRERLRVVITLTRNDSQVTKVPWDCRIAATCGTPPVVINRVGGARDEAGDQRWCTVAIGYATDALVSQATACEEDATP